MAKTVDFNKPVSKAKLGHLELAEFHNAEHRISFNLQKSYKDTEGKWVNQNITLFPEDMVAAKYIFQKTDVPIFFKLQ